MSGFVGRAAGLVLLVGGAALLVFLAVVSYGDIHGAGRLLVSIGMPMTFILALTGAALTGLGAYLLLHRPARRTPAA